ncbi:MAG: sulfotransferase domain-containing protein [Gammaproteobacteria bacterium]
MLLVQNPHDILSYYHFMTRRRQIQPSKPMGVVLGDAFWPRIWIMRARHENVGGWLGAREGTLGFVTVRYEDLKADPASELMRTCCWRLVKNNLTRVWSSRVSCR